MRWRTAYSDHKVYLFRWYGDKQPPKTIREILDRLDVIREELLSLQRSLQKLATAEAVERGSKDGVPDGSDVGP